MLVSVCFSAQCAKAGSQKVFFGINDVPRRATTGSKICKGDVLRLLREWKQAAAVQRQRLDC